LLLDPSFADLDPAENDTFLRKIKIRDTTFFGGEVKPPVLCCKILRNVKEPYTYEKRYFIGKIHGHFSPSIALLRFLVSLLVTSRELWWTNQ
jgi:hypothetical protein